VTFSPDPEGRLRHAGPPLGIVATIFVLLFIAGLYPVTIFGGTPFFPGPSETLDVIVAFFQGRSSAVLLCAALHFGAAIPLGIFTATVVSQLRFLGVRAAGTYIALFGGFATAFNIMASSSVLSGHSAGLHTSSGSLSPAIRVGRSGILRAVRPIDRRRVGDRGIHQAVAEVDCHPRSADRGGRGTELARHPVPESPLPDSPHSISGFRLAHRCGLRAAQQT
jgi:hypothetical protein